MYRYRKYHNYSGRCCTGCGVITSYSIHYTKLYDYDLWEHGLQVTDSWDNKGDIVIGNDVWIGHDAVIMAGVTIGDGASRITSYNVCYTKLLRLCISFCFFFC